MVLTWHLYRRMMRRGRLIGLGALSAVPGLVYWLAALEGDEPGRLYTDIIATVGYTFAIAAAILTVSTLREERDSGTLPYIYMRPISRPALAGSALLAGAAGALTLAFIAWLALLGGVLLAGVDLEVGIPGIVHLAGAGVGYAAVFVPLGYLVPRALLVALGYILVIETILANVVTGLAQISIWRIALSVYAAIEDEVGEGIEQVLGPVGPGMGGGLAKLAVVTMLGLATLVLALRYRDAL